jgi:hypothetical protein
VAPGHLDDAAWRDLAPPGSEIEDLCLCRLPKPSKLTLKMRRTHAPQLKYIMTLDGHDEMEMSFALFA